MNAVEGIVLEDVAKQASTQFAKQVETELRSAIQGLLLKRINLRQKHERLTKEAARAAEDLAAVTEQIDGIRRGDWAQVPDIEVKEKA